MRIIICLDDKNGMMFNNRRLSRDAVVCEDIITNLADESLKLLTYSVPLFEAFSEKITVVEDVCGEGVFFVENKDIQQLLPEIEEIIVYGWNRVYPSDFICNVDFSVFHIKSQVEFKGNSHEKITKTIYCR